MVAQLGHFSYQQLSRAAALQAKIEALEKELATVLGGNIPAPTQRARGASSPVRRKRVISPEGKARIIAAQKARWARVKAAKKAAAKSAR